MKIIRYQTPERWTWSPLQPLATLHNEVNRLFNYAGWGRSLVADQFSGWTPALDVVEEKDNLVVKAELPGVKKEEIEISVNDGVLSISGERKNEAEVKDGETVRSERFFGRFQRTVALPKPVSVEQAKASYQDGVLTVVLPKTEAAKPKQISVSVK